MKIECLYLQPVLYKILSDVESRCSSITIYSPCGFGGLMRINPISSPFYPKPRGFFNL